MPFQERDWVQRINSVNGTEESINSTLRCSFCCYSLGIAKYMMTYGSEAATIMRIWRNVFEDGECLYTH